MRWRYGQGWGLSLLGCVWGGLVLVLVYLLSTRLLPVQTWQIEAELGGVASLAQAEQTLKTWHLEEGGRGDLSRLHAQLEALPGIKAVDLRRCWPKDLLVYLTPYRAKARWGEYGILTEDGERIYPPVEDLPLDRVQLWGAEEEASWLGNFSDWAQSAVQPLGHRIRSIKLSFKDKLEISLDQGIGIILRKETAHTSLPRCLRAWGTHFQLMAAGPQSLDCRYAQGVAVSWKDK